MDFVAAQERCHFAPSLAVVEKHFESELPQRPLSFDDGITRAALGLA
jgi:hypothetical protein